MAIIKNSAIYLFSSMINKGIPFMVLPIFTFYLSPEEYGMASIFTLMITIFSAFIGMGLNTNVSKFYHNVTEEKMALINGNIFLVLCTSYLIVQLLTIIFGCYNDSLFSIPIEFINLIPLISMMVMTNDVNTTLIRNQERPILFGVFEISNTFIKVVVALILLVYYNYGWKSQVVGFMISSSIFFIIAFLFMYKNRLIKIEYDKKIINDILKTSLPLIPHLIGTVIISLSDRIFIEQLIGLEAVGIYSVGYTFGMIIMIGTDAFIKAWSPWFFKSMANSDGRIKIKIVKYTYLYIIGLVLCSLILAFIGNLILKLIVDEKYFGAGPYIFWVTLGYAFNGVYKIFFPYLVFANRTSFLAFSTVSAAVINLVLNYFFIIQFGAIGAAYSTACSFLITSTFVFFYQKRFIDMPWNLKIKS